MAVLLSQWLVDNEYRLIERRDALKITLLDGTPVPYEKAYGPFIDQRTSTVP